MRSRRARRNGGESSPDPVDCSLFAGTSTAHPADAALTAGPLQPLAEAPRRWGKLAQGRLPVEGGPSGSHRGGGAESSKDSLASVLFALLAFSALFLSKIVLAQLLGSKIVILPPTPSAGAQARLLDLPPHIGKVRWTVSTPPTGSQPEAGT